VRTCGGGIAA